MRLFPLLYNENLSEADVEELNCSDHIWISNDLFRQYMETAEPGIAVIVRLSNFGQSAFAAVYSTHSNDDDIIYVPHWMYRKLDYDTDDVNIERVMPNLCTRLLLQPHTSDHLKCADPQEALRDAFEAYSCLEKGDTIPIWLGGKAVDVTLQGLEPAEQATQPLCIRNCEIELELLPPLDMPLPPPPAPAPTPAPAPPDPSTAPHNTFVGQGRVLGGAHDSSKSPRELMREAAIRRLAANASQPATT